MIIIMWHIGSHICLHVQTSFLQDVTQNNVQINWQIFRLNTKTTKANISLVKQSIYNNNLTFRCHTVTA